MSLSSIVAEKQVKSGIWVNVRLISTSSPTRQPPRDTNRQSGSFTSGCRGQRINHDRWVERRGSESKERQDSEQGEAGTEMEVNSCAPLTYYSLTRRLTRSRIRRGCKRSRRRACQPCLRSLLSPTSAGRLNLPRRATSPPFGDARVRSSVSWTITRER